MRFTRTVTVSALALLAVTLVSGSASADHRHRMRVLWPKIFAPEFSGYLYRDELDDEDDGFFDLEDEADYRARNRRDRRIALELYGDDEDYEPRYVPPKKATPRKTVKKTTTKKPLAKSTQTVAAIAKPKLKTASKTPVKVTATPVVAMAEVPADLAGKTPVLSQTAAATPAKPNVVAKPLVVSKPKTQVASASPTAGAIGCSKGAEIVSGYGFTSVKPRSCSGTNYSFDATRGASGYLIKLSAATGEITDVTKLK